MLKEGDSLRIALFSFSHIPILVKSEAESALRESTTTLETTPQGDAEYERPLTT